MSTRAAAALSPDEARLLDDAGFTEDPDAYARVAADTVAHMALLVDTAYSAREMATALNVNASRVRQRRLARTLWAIDDNVAWVFPALQFETDPQTGRPCKQIRGLDRVFAALAGGRLGQPMTPDPTSHSSTWNPLQRVARSAITVAKMVSSWVFELAWSRSRFSMSC